MNVEVILKKLESADKALKGLYLTDLITLDKGDLHKAAERLDEIHIAYMRASLTCKRLIDALNAEEESNE